MRRRRGGLPSAILLLMFAALCAWGGVLVWQRGSSAVSDQQNAWLIDKLGERVVAGLILAFGVFAAETAVMILIRRIAPRSGERADKR